MLSRWSKVVAFVFVLALMVIGSASARSHPRRHVVGPREAICRVFHPCAKALQVAWCESRFDVYARNGQYLGLFQMGEYARSTYGHSWTALGQARAAHRYYMDAGWSPWSCA